MPSLDRVDPNAFTIPAATASYLGDNLAGLSSAMYFSFVTLTTLGYGDITPINNFARSLAFLEAAMGQIYLTVLIASLVGVHISTSSKGENIMKTYLPVYTLVYYIHANGHCRLPGRISVPKKFPIMSM